MIGAPRRGLTSRREIYSVNKQQRRTKSLNSNRSDTPLYRLARTSTNGLCAVLIALNCVVAPAAGQDLALSEKARASYAGWTCAELAKEQHHQFLTYRTDRRIAARRATAHPGMSRTRGAKKLSRHLRVGLVILPRGERSAVQQVTRSVSHATASKRFRSSQRTIQKTMARKGCRV